MQAVIAHHEKRGNMERFTGELKWKFNADHLPCQTLAPNAIFAGVMLLTCNLLYHLQDLMSERNIPHRKFSPGLKSG